MLNATYLIKSFQELNINLDSIRNNITMCFILTLHKNFFIHLMICTIVRAWYLSDATVLKKKLYLFVSDSSGLEAVSLI